MVDPIDTTQPYWEETTLGVKDLYAHNYRVTASHPAMEDGDEVVFAVSGEHAIKIMLSAYLATEVWQPENVLMFYSLSSEDLKRLVPELKFSAQLLGKEAEA